MLVASSKDRQIFVEILSASFANNRSIRYVVKNDDREKLRIRKLIEYSFNKALRSGHLFLSDNRRACCLVLDTSKQELSLKSVLQDLKLLFQVIGIQNVKSVLKRGKLLKQNQPKSPFYHLWYIGVLPESQGSGVGTKLLNEVLEYLDQNKRPIYLETSVLKNVEWYSKLGFRKLNTLTLGYDLHVMMR